MFLSKHLLNINNIIKTIIIIVFFLLIFLINYFYSLDYVKFQLNDLGVVYLGDQQVMSSTNSDDVEGAVQTYKAIENSESSGKLNTSYVSSKTLASIPSEKQSMSEYLEKNSVFLSDGYSLTIDDETIYFSDIEFINWSKNKIIDQLLNDDELYKQYLENGEIPTFTKDGKNYSSFGVENNIEVTKDYLPASKIIDNQEDFMYYLMHGDDPKQIVELSDDNSIASIQSEYGLSDQEFNLNNPTISNNQLLHNGTEIIVNPLNPVIDISYNYEFEQTEQIMYTTEYVEDSSLPQGTETVLKSGENGSELVTYETKILNGQAIGTSRVSSVVTKNPINAKIAQGTFVVPDMGSGNWFWPASSHSITNYFDGWSVTGRSYHGAIDIQSWYGAPIYAADNGTVTNAGPADEASGTCVFINHNNGFVTKYCHMSAVAVAVGDTVSSGQLIGYEGQTGYTTGEHVHYQMLENGVAVNPLQYY